MPRLPSPRPLPEPTLHEMTLRAAALVERERGIGEHVEQRNQRYLERLEADERAAETTARQQEQVRAWLRGFDAGDR